MSLITKDEILKLAKISQISITEAEVEKVQGEIEAILQYASILKDIAQNNKIDGLEFKNKNVTRQDIISRTDAEVILSRAPLTQDNFFVVPAIIKQGE